MTDIKDIKTLVEKTLVEYRLKKFRENLDNIHYMEADGGAPDATTVVSRDFVHNVQKDPSAQSNPRAEKSSQYYTGEKMTPEGKAALKMNSIWTNNVAQLMNYRKGQELAAVISQRLENKTGLPARQMLPIVQAIMKATLEQLDEEVSTQIENDMPGVLDTTRS